MLSKMVLDDGIIRPVSERIYTNQGNPALIDLLSEGCNRLLDIGCGAGDNADLIKCRYPECEVFGITHSVAESELAQQHMTRCWVFNIEDKPQGSEAMNGHYSENSVCLRTYNHLKSLSLR